MAEAQATNGVEEENAALINGHSEEEVIEKKEEIRPISTYQLFRFASRSELFVFAIGVLLSLAVGTINPYVNYLNGKVATLYANTSQPVGNEDFLYSAFFYAKLAFSCGVLLLFTSFAEMFCHTWVCERIIDRIRREFLTSVLAQECAFFDCTSSGKLSNQLNSNIDRIRVGLGAKMAAILRNISLCTSSMILCFTANWQLSMIMIGCAPFSVVFAHLYPKLTRRYESKIIELCDEANTIAEESILSVKTVQACNAQEYMTNRYQSTLRRVARYAIRSGCIAGFLDGFFVFVMYCLYVVGLWTGVHRYHAGLIAAPGDVIMILSLSLHYAGYMGNLGVNLKALFKARLAAAAVYATIDRKPKNRSDDNDVAEEIDPSELED